MNKKIDKLLECFLFLRKKNINLLLLFSIIIILFLLSIGLYLGLLDSDDTPYNSIAGIVYIDGQPAPEGIQINFILSNKSLLIGNVTNEAGMYSIDATNFNMELFTIQIIYREDSYIGTDEAGTIINTSFMGSKNLWLDIFVNTSPLMDEKIDDIDENSINNDHDEDVTESEEHNDPSDDKTDTDEKQPGDNEDSDSAIDVEDDDDESSNDDSVDESNEEISINYLLVKKTVWNTDEEVWKKNEASELGETVRFNITITYNSSNLSNIVIMDSLPDGLNYSGNATINGDSLEPSIYNGTQFLQWTISGMSKINTTLYVEYDTIVSKRKILQNNVTVDLVKNELNLLQRKSNSTVNVIGELIVSKKVKNNTGMNWHESITVDLGKPIRFNITVRYEGNHSISNLTILDEIPDELNLLGNITINNQESNHIISEKNQTIQWHISTLFSNEIVFIEFDANITKNMTAKNTVQVTADESLGKKFDIAASATVTGRGSQLFNCEKTVQVGNSSWKKYINAYVGDTATFRVHITNLGLGCIGNVKICDRLPSSLSYINGSSIFYYKNQSFFKEPGYDEQTNSYYWGHINNLITEDFVVGDSIILQYTVFIQQGGFYSNQVTANVLLCGDAHPLLRSSFATINASIPHYELTVNISVPDTIYVNEFVEINAYVIGGNPPYSYAWDLDDDMIYDDEYTASFIKKWGDVGNYPIRIRVTDNDSNMTTDSFIVNVTVRQLMVNAGGPYSANLGEVIQFEGFATGGIGNYKWNWDFKDENSSKMKNPLHTYTYPGSYQVTLQVTDERNITVSDATIVIIKEPDTTPPIIIIESPINAFYISNQPLFQFITPLVFGSIDINVSVVDNESLIESIELFINDQLVEKISGNSSHYSWDDITFGRHTITVKANNEAGLISIKNKILWKFF